LSSHHNRLMHVSLKVKGLQASSGSATCGCSSQ
jgi:hypothetical protein